MKSFDIAVIIPSRGLIFAETFKEILAELDSYTYKIYWSHGNPIPKCFNQPINKALKAKHTHILIIEDDMVIKKGVLKELLDLNKPIVACDYPTTETPSGATMYDIDDTVLFAPTGFMLIQADVLRSMPKPIFRSDIQWDFKIIGDTIQYTPQIVDDTTVYGYHDVTFGLYWYLHGLPIVIAKTILSQRKLVSKGVSGTNKGQDTIVLYDKYRKIDLGFEKQSSTDPITKDIVLDGQTVMFPIKIADDLISKHEATEARTTVNHVVVDFTKAPQLFATMV